MFSCLHSLLAPTLALPIPVLWLCHYSFAIGNQGVNVLNAQARIRLVKADRRSVCSRCEVNKLLQVFTAGRRRRVYAEFEYQIEDLSDVLGEVGDVCIKGAVIHSKKTNLVVLERHELREVGRADLVQ